MLTPLPVPPTTADIWDKPYAAPHAAFRYAANQPLHPKAMVCRLLTLAQPSDFIRTRGNFNAGRPPRRPPYPRAGPRFTLWRQYPSCEGHRHAWAANL